jgi:hypothetical protein
MKRFKKLFMITIGCLWAAGLAQEAPKPVTDVPAKITLPWTEFKDILNLDDREIVISIATFQKLVEQTGSRIKPPYTIENGNVILSRSAFDQLVSQMKPPQNQDEKPPFEYLITRSEYTGRMQPESTRFTARFEIHVLAQEGYVRIPILSQDLALEAFRVDGKPGLVVSQNGYHTALLKNSGTTVIQVEFSIQSSLEKGPHRIDFQIQKTPITLLDLEIPLTGIDVDIPQSQQMTTRIRDGRTEIRSVLSSGNQISIRWRKQLAAAEKIPAKLYAEVHHLISIEDDALKTNSELLLTILHSEIEEMRLRIPQEINLLSVSGEGVGEWQEESQDDQRILRIPFTYSKKGNMSIMIVSEAPFRNGESGTVFQGFECPDAVRETGFIGIELNTSAEVNTQKMENVEQIPIQKLPSGLISRSRKPILLGFKYLSHPYRVVLSIVKHEKIAVPMATIESANAVTLFTEDGKIVHRLVYQVRNSAKQFLEQNLPDQTDVWSVFVDNTPVESSINSNGNLLIPLNRSVTEGNRLNTFSVEVILCQVQNPFSAIHELDMHLPGVDILTSQLIWSVYLPNDYTYRHFRSTLEKEEIIRGIQLFGANKRSLNMPVKDRLSSVPGVQPAPEEALEGVYQGKESKSRFRNVPVDENQMMSQMEQELDFGDRLDALSKQESAGTAGGGTATGILPIQIKIPTSGQVYRFAKTIIKPEDPLRVQVWYARQWISDLIRWFFILIGIVIICLLRRLLLRIAMRIRIISHGLITLLRKHGKDFQQMSRSRLFPWVLLGAAIILYRFIPFLAFLFFFGFCLAGIDRIYQFRENRKKRKK